MRSFAAVALVTSLFAMGCTSGEVSQGDFAASEVSPTAICTTDDVDSEACVREDEVAERFEALREDPEALAHFLDMLPKGGDLHSHLSGAVQTERLVEWAIEDGRCLKDSTMKLASCNSSGTTPVAEVDHDALLSAWSMEGFEGSVQEGHDHFFATFGRFGAVTKTRTADMLAAVRNHAAERGESYLELMLALGTSGAGRAGGYAAGELDSWDEESLLQFKERLLARSDFQDNLAATAAELAAFDEQSEQILGCDGEEPAAGCGVEVRYLVQVWRASSRESVFGQIVHAYELGKQDPRVVGLNLAAAEDNPLALSGYDDAMQALAIVRSGYDHEFHVALHAGELVPSLLSDEDQSHTTFHIREAVLTAGAERIGHGIDILSEESEDLSSVELREQMRDRGVAVEICLSSNKYILGVEGPEHPMAAYLESDVPMVIATDDEGVSRSSLTSELATATHDQQLSYYGIKELMRRSLEHGFASGASLFGEMAITPTLQDGCASTASCGELADASDKARLQLRLEAQLASFERAVLDP